LWRRCAALLRGQLLPPPDITISSGEYLSIPLRTHPLAIRVSLGSGMAVLACSLQLALRDQQWLAMVLLAATATAALAMRRDLWLLGPDAPGCLEVTAEGKVQVVARNGGVHRVAIRPQSLRLGTGVLLVLQGERTWRLLLAGGNVEPACLAALFRRLGPVAPGPPGLR
jgi:hypothetical protein